MNLAQLFNILHRATMNDGLPEDFGQLDGLEKLPRHHVKFCGDDISFHASAMHDSEPVLTSCHRCDAHYAVVEGEVYRIDYMT